VCAGLFIYYFSSTVYTLWVGRKTPTYGGAGEIKYQEPNEIRKEGPSPQDIHMCKIQTMIQERSSQSATLK
jgi:hypothetical protein